MGESKTVSTWQRPATGLDRQSLQDLMAGDIPAIVITGFASHQECSALCRAIRSHGDQAEDAKTSRMTLIGANFSNYAGETKAAYFDQVGPSWETLGSILAEAGFNPLQRMIERLIAIWPGDVEVASEPGHGRYFAGGIKTRSSSGHLHYDFAPHTAEGYAIAEIIDQLGWNLYLDMPEGTGETTTYRRPVARDGGKAGSGPARALNLDHDFVEGAEAFTFRPSVGDVAIINTRYPHTITVENAGQCLQLQVANRGFAFSIGRGRHFVAIVCRLYPAAAVSRHIAHAAARRPAFAGAINPLGVLATGHFQAVRRSGELHFLHRAARHVFQSNAAPAEQVGRSGQYLE